MNESNRNGFLVVPKGELKFALKDKGIEEDDTIYHPIVLTSKSADLEFYPPGTLTILNNELKAFYIINHVYLFLQGKSRTENILGLFSTEVELFDKYWVLKDALCMEVGTNITYE